MRIGTPEAAIICIIIDVPERGSPETTVTKAGSLADPVLTTQYSQLDTTIQYSRFRTHAVDSTSAAKNASPSTSLPSRL